MQSKAFDLGKEKYPWWPDWRNKPVAIVASGPSTGSFPIERLKDVTVLAIKRNIDKVPWAEVCYGCDAPWWISRHGLPDYKGIKLTHGDKALARYSGLQRVIIADRKCERVLVDEPLSLGAGGNSGFQALNLAIQFGASRILLIGYDYHARSGLHWYGRNSGYGMTNPDAFSFGRWVPAMTGIAPWLREHGIQVFNASSISDLKCFPRGSIETILPHASVAA